MGLSPLLNKIFGIFPNVTFRKKHVSVFSAKPLFLKNSFRYFPQSHFFSKTRFGIFRKAHFSKKKPSVFSAKQAVSLAKPSMTEKQPSTVL